jgi:hypothetical protein
MLLNNVIPAIKAKWPAGDTKSIKLQQDNARPHVPVNDPVIVAACTQDGWYMRIVCQPPNSPDLNVLDLGFFRAVQTLQQRQNCKNIDDLIVATVDAWENVPMDNLTRNFLTLQSVMQEIIGCKGDNSFKIPHMKKSALMAKGRLPESIECCKNKYDIGFNCLTETDMVERQRQLQLEVAQSLVGKDVFETLEDFSIGNTDNDNDEDSIMFIYEEPHLDFDDHDEAM